MIISVLNHKGGTGKTTTTINLGKAIADLGYQVLLVDFDLQANLSYSLGIEDEYSLETLLECEEDLMEHIVEKGNLSVLPNTRRGFEQDRQLSSPHLLANALTVVSNYYDFIFIDCPPTISDHALNALCASEFVLTPFQLDVLSVQGVGQVISSIEQVNRTYNHNLEILGVVPVMVDKRRMLTTEILEHLKGNYDLHIFNSVVRTNVKIAEAPSFGKSVIDYKKTSTGSLDYQELAKEFIEITTETKLLT